ncbi:hypothetical protein, partial [Deinococcus sp.]|uniref:hypothetical protein n=1 Tax=Deinococcus sp. TaxID=47478 RepID=UPI0028698A22
KVIQFKNKMAMALFGLLVYCASAIAQSPLVVQAKRILTAAGQTIENGTVVCVDGKIRAIGKTGEDAWAAYLSTKG